MEAAPMVRCAHMLMRAMKDDLQETSTVEPVFVLLHSCSCDFVRFDPLLLNSVSGKAVIAWIASSRAIFFLRPSIKTFLEVLHRDWLLQRGAKLIDGYQGPDQRGSPFPDLVQQIEQDRAGIL